MFFPNCSRNHTVTYTNQCQNTKFQHTPCQLSANRATKTIERDWNWRPISLQFPPSWLHFLDSSSGSRYISSSLGQTIIKQLHISIEGTVYIFIYFAQEWICRGGAQRCAPLLALVNRSARGLTGVQENQIQKYGIISKVFPFLKSNWSS
jgi:hypothetical protein